MTQVSETITVIRDVSGIQIPDGTPVLLRAGDRVMIRQSLGGDYTVQRDCGDLVRIDGKDADAINREPTLAAVGGPESFSEEAVWDVLRTIYDPEIPVDVVELGLIYDCVVGDLPSGGHSVHIRMTLTAPGCGMGEILKQDVERKLAGIPGVDQVRVDIVFDPPWDQSLLSDNARLQLGLMW